MLSKTYPWKRYWLPRGGRVTFSDDGYVIDPESFGGKIYGADLVTLDQLSSKQCLILLGEPGIGKSTTLSLHRTTVPRAMTPDASVLWRDLGEYQTDSRLCDDVFGNDVIERWRDEDRDLFLYLDSFDECQIDAPALGKLLVSQMSKLPIDRLYLRLVCRTAAWPSALEERLRKLYEALGGIEVYELAPLRRTDVHLAAMFERLNPDQFLREVDLRDVVPLVLKPVTLRFLLETFRKAGHFPPKQQGLYEAGCHLLCEETNPDRFGSRQAGELNADQRLAIASRIAALTIICQKAAIWQGIDYGDVPLESITVPTMCGDNEVTYGYKFPVREADVREVLSTGLFSSRGSQRLGWAHATFAEFLAARYLVEHDLTLTQMWSLVSRADENGRERIVPQLSDTAAWLASLLPDLRRATMDHDPDVLLRSYAFTASEAQDRSRLVQALLDLLDDDQVASHDREHFRRYRHLSHPGLADQLRPVIQDPTQRETVRVVAIEIAAANNENELQGNLVDVALNRQCSSRLRARAAWALGQIGDVEQRAALRQSLELDAETDPEDELKGSVLTGLWPDLLTAEELFSRLTPPRRSNLLGRYRAFANFDLPRTLRVSDLPPALDWVARQPDETTPSVHPFGTLIDAIMVQGWDHLHAPGVLDAYARAAWSRLHSHDQLARGPDARPFRELLFADDDRRHTLADAILQLVTAGVTDAFWLTAPPTPVIQTKDVVWLLGRLKTEDRTEQQAAIIRSIQMVANPNDPQIVDAIYEECQQNNALAKAFGWLFDPVDLNSELARTSRADYRREQQRKQRRSTLINPPSAERIAYLLDECEQGNPDAWWRLTLEMTLESTSEFYGSELESDLSALPGWRDSDPEIQLRIVQAAGMYLREGDPQNDQWLGTNVVHRRALAGYKALRLLLQMDPSSLANLSADKWKQWSPIVVAFPTYEDRDKEAQQTLAWLAYTYAPDELIQALLTIVRQEDRDHGNVFVLARVERIIDERLIIRLRELVADSLLKPESLGEVLRVLLLHQPVAIQGLLAQLLPLPTDESGLRRAVVVARTVIEHAPDEAWTTIWPLFESHPTFGRLLTEEIAHSHDFLQVTVSSRLTEEQVADLFAWLVQQYPPSEDPSFDDVHWVGPRESIAQFRDGLLMNLVSRGTMAACQAIARIREQFPELHYLKRLEAQAHAIRRARCWQPPSPTQLLHLVRRQDRRFVDGGDQLLDVLIESLKRLEIKLHGETPARIFLWNE